MMKLIFMLYFNTKMKALKNMKKRECNMVEKCLKENRIWSKSCSSTLVEQSGKFYWQLMDFGDIISLGSTVASNQKIPAKHHLILFDLAVL